MRTAAVIGLPVAAETVATALDGHDDFRVLRRIRPMRRNGGGVEPGMYVGCAVDIVATGPDLGDHEIVELALQRFWGAVSGGIVTTGRLYTWLEEPNCLVPDEVTRASGLTDEDVAGHRIVDPVAASLIADADFVVAHDAGRIRPFVEARLPYATGRPWVCTMTDMNWVEHGFVGRELSYLLCQAGWFFDEGRAGADVAALLRLLDHPLPSGGTVLSEAVAQASVPSRRIEVAGAPFEAGRILQAHGYRWNENAALWHRDLPSDDWGAEEEWVALEIYGGLGAPRAREVTWRERHALS